MSHERHEEADQIQAAPPSITPDTSPESTMGSSMGFYEEKNNGFSTEKEVVPLPEKEVAPSRLPETCAANADPNPAVEKEVVPGPKSRKSRYCNQSRRTTLLLAALCVILFALGIGLGLGLGLAAKRRRSQAAPESSLHPLSRVAATNWTDPAGYDHQAVFYQAPTKAIMLSLWDSQNRTWSAQPVNVTRIGADVAANPAIAIDILPGTALAAASLSLPDGYLELNIYYQSSQLYLYELYTHDPTGVSGWTLGTPTWAVPTLNGSGLAAYHEPCQVDVKECTIDNTTMYVLYQDNDDKRKSSYEHPVRLLNRTGYSWHRGFEITLPGQPVGGTDVAVVPVTDGAGSTGVAALFDNVQDSTRLLQTQGQAKNWTQDIVVNNVPTDPSPQVAATSYGKFGFTETLVGVLGQDGAIATYVSGTKRDLHLDKLADKKFSALSLGLNMRAFGIVEDNIAEFSFTRPDPTSWSFVGNVLP